MRTYGRYCPIARGVEIFSERWTPIIIRNLVRTRVFPRWFESYRWSQ